MFGDGTTQFVAEFDAGRLRQRDCFQREQRILCESHRIACEMQLPIFDTEEISQMCAAWARKPARLCVRGGVCACAREDHFAELVKLAGAAIVVAHELFGGAQVRRRTITKLRGERRLTFKREPFGLAPREPVQTNTHAQQKIISVLYSRALVARDVTLHLQTCERAA